MPNKITYTITTSDGKAHQVSEDNINKYGMKSYADAYDGATIRMRDKDGADYDIPLGNFNDARKQGLHPYRFEHLPAREKSGTSSDVGGHARQVVDDYDRSVAMNSGRGQSRPANKGHQMTAAERQGMMSWASNASQAVGQSVKESNDKVMNLRERARKPIRVRENNLGAGPTPYRLGENPNVVETGQTFDPESGKARPSYITSSGNEYNERGLADLEQGQIDDARARELDPVNTALNDAYMERDRLNALMEQRMKEIDNESKGVGSFLREFAEASRQPGMTNPMARYQADERYRQLEAAARKNKAAIRTLEDKRDDKMDNFWHSAMSTAGNGYSFTNGMSEINDAIALMDARKHIDSINKKRREGKALTREEEAAEAVLLNEVANNDVQDKYGSEYGKWSRAGDTFTGSVDFMQDFFLTPGAGGIAKGIAKRVGGIGAKYLAKEAGETAAKAIPKAIARGVLKGTGILLGAHTAGAVISNTAGFGRTAATMGTNMVGDISMDDKGNIKNDDGMGFMESLVDAERNQIRENGSEMFGEFIPGVGGLITKGMDKLGLSKITGALQNIGNKRWYRQYSSILKAGGYNGIPGEALEEYEGIAFDALTGHTDDAWQQLEDPKTHVDIWLGCATMGALLGAVPTTIQGAHTAQYYRYKHAADMADKTAGYRIGQERWDELRESIDGTPNENMKDKVMSVINDKNLNSEEKVAALNYVRNLTKMRGFDIAQMTNANEETEENKRANSSYSDGYNSDESADKQDIRNRYEQNVSVMTAGLGISEEQLDDTDWIAEARREASSGTEEGRQRASIMLDYVNSKQAYDGMIQRVRDDIDSRVEESNQMVDSRTNKDSGMIEGATMKMKKPDGTDRKVYVVRGNVVMMEDGSGIDREKSDSSVMIRDAETGEVEMVSPESIFSVDQPLEPEEEKMTAAETIRQAYAQEAANEIDGTVSFNLEDTYTLTDGNGQQSQVRVMANEQGIVDNGDGTVNVSSDGGQTVVPMKKEDIQAMVDATNRARVARQTQPTQAQQTSRQPVGTYNQNDELTLRDENGNETHATIIEGEDADGRYLVETDSPINGNMVYPYTAEELDSMRVDGMNTEDAEGVVGQQQATGTGTESQSLPIATVNQEALNNATVDDYKKVNSGIVDSVYRENPSMVQEELLPRVQATVEYINGNMSPREYLASIGYATGENSWLDDESTTDDEIASKANEERNKLMPYVNMPQVNITEETAETEEGAGAKEGTSDTREAESHVGETVTVDGMNGVVVGTVPGAYEVRWEDGAQTIVPGFEYERMRNEMAPQPGLGQEPGQVGGQVEQQSTEPRQQQSALDRVPKDEQGQPIYEQADPDTSWDAIMEQTQGDAAMAKSVVDSMVADKEAELKKVEKAKPKGGTTIAEKIAAEQQRKNDIEQAKATLAQWQRIAQTPQRRAAAEMNERARQEEEASRQRRAAEEQRRAELEEAERQRREALRGVPDIIDDTPQDARARGYRRVNGEKVDRQEPLQATQGREVEVKFDNKNIPTGHATLIEASQLQPSHLNGHRNPLHFLDEAQPKERTDDASVMEARRIAANMRPEEITSMPTAYTGAPTVNTRGEVIQGNNRSAALREMWTGEPEQAQQYRQYLRDHAEEFGLTPDQLDAMEQPVLVKMLDVDDADAITLGQFEAQDTESGGTERIKAKNVAQKMESEGDMRTYANQMLNSPDEEMTFSELIDRNGAVVLEWMNRKGYITPTQYRSAFDSKGNLTAEAKNDLKGIMYQGIFQNGNTHLEEMFSALPAKAQKAILAVAYRDYDSPNTERMNGELQASISAYYVLSQVPEFANAKNYKEARAAAEAWKRQLAFDDVTGESYLPSEKYSNFAVLLATMYKWQTQRFIQNTLGDIYDMVQGTREATLFEQPDNTPMTLVEAINEAINKRATNLLLNGEFEYNGQRRSDVLAVGSAASQQGREGSPGSAPAGERAESGERAAGSARRTVSSNAKRGGQGDLRHSSRRQQDNQTSEQEEYTISSKRSGNGEPFYQDVNGNIDLVNIPKEVFDEIGYSKAPFRLTPSMILHVLNGHGKELGVNTVEDTIRFVLDVMRNFDHVRLGYDGALVFSIENGRKRTGKRAVTILINSDNGQFYGLKTSGYENINGLNKRPLLWERGANEVSSTTDAASASVSTSKSPVSGEQSGSASHQSNNLSTGKDTRTPLKSQAIGEKIAKEEEKVEQNPTYGQKEAGNYKKGHVRIDGHDVTIENPKGSVRRGTDANGNTWENTMNNTYGYIRGTEGVDGDHIDVFLSDDPTQGNVYVIDQVNPDTGEFDEHKVMYGFNSAEEARDAYLANYSPGWKGLGTITEVSKDEFKKWINSSHRKTKPFSEYKSVNATSEGNGKPKLRPDRELTNNAPGLENANGTAMAYVTNYGDSIVGYRTTGNAQRFENGRIVDAGPAIQIAFERNGQRINQTIYAKSSETLDGLKAWAESWKGYLRKEKGQTERNTQDSDNAEEARDAYLANYSPGWKGLDTITKVSKDEDNQQPQKDEPFAEYKIVNKTTPPTDSQIVGEFYSPKKLRSAYESGNEEQIAEGERRMREFIESNNDTEGLMKVYGTYFHSRDLERKIEDDETGRRVYRFISNSCKAMLKEAGLPAKAMQSERARTEVAGSTTHPHVLDIMSADTSFNVLRAIINNPNTSESTLKHFTKVFSNNGLDYEAQQELYKRQSENDDVRFREAEEDISDANEKFNEQLEGLTEENAQSVILNLGRPNNILRSAGIDDRPIRLYGNKLMKKIRKHGFDLSDIKDLPLSINNPIGVFNNYGKKENRAVLTELQTSKGNVLVTIEWGKGTDAELNIVTSVFGKGSGNVVDWINKGFATYINKEKALNYLRISAPIAEAQDNQELVSAANIVRNFENPNISDGNLLFRDDDISDFARKHDLNEKDVQDYADYMRQGNLNGASGAFTDIRRKVRIDNKGVSLGEFAKIFSPIRKELYEKFGNIDDLREQYVQAEMEERNMMEAARKRAEEAAEAERKRLQVFQDMSDEQLDEEYYKAVEEKDEGRMRDLVNEAARRNGYGDVGSEYQGVGAWSAPSNPGYESDEERRAALETDGNDVNVADMAQGYTIQPEDYFTNLRAYGNDTPHGRESAEAINKAMDETRKGKDPMIKVYRAVPKTVKEGKLRNGDWVTPSRKYAEMHGNNRLEGNYRIIEQEVPASQLWWDGNDINEWGFDDGKDYAYRNTKNNRKLNDLVTRDDNGNIIPLSQRFNARKADVRYRFIGEQGAARLDAAEEATTRLDNLDTARRMEQAYNDKKARIGKLRNSEPVEITGEEIETSDDLKQYKKNALEYGKKLQGNYVNKDTGRTIQLQRGRKNGGLKEVLQHDINDVAHIKSVAAIPQIIENSIYIDSADNHDTKKNPNVSKYNYYVCGLKIGGIDYTVRMVEAEDKDGNRYYDHKLTHIEKGNLIDNNETAFVQTSSTGLSSTPGTGAEERNRPTNRGEIQAAPISKSKDRVLISLLQTNDQENARKIKLATGWERGADGKWRYETPDFEYHPNGDARRNDKYKESDWYKELYDLEERLFGGETLTDEETKRFDELSARENEIRDNDKNTERMYLDDYVKDDELFKAYPELKRTKVDFVDLPNAEYSAKYNGQENRITVNMAKTMDTKSVLAHEIQHAIQRIEGFASGSNPGNYRYAATSENVIADINAATGGRLVESGGFDNTPEGIFDALNRKTKYGTILRDNSDELDEVAREYGYETIFDLVNDIDKFKSSVQMYRSEAGEVEARNVEERLDMTPEQRRGTLAEETEDVAREDQQFLLDAIGTDENHAAAEQTTNIDTAVADMARTLNIDVRVARSIDEVDNEGARRAIENGRNVKGWYDTRTGEIVVYAPNATDVDDAVRTVLHEGVAHYGLRKLVGEENFNTFLDNLYNNVSPEPQRKIDAMSQRHGWSTRTATEEYLASLAEDTNFEEAKKNGLWKRIKDFFVDLLAKVGVRLNKALTDNELRYLLWRSYENLQEHGKHRSIFGEAEDVVKQKELKVGNYAPTSESRRPSMTLAMKEISELDNVNEDYNKSLDKFSKGEMRSSDVFNLGRPSGILLTCGLPDSEIKMTQSVVRSHMKKHGLTTEDLRDLPISIRKPIMVYEWGDKARSMIIITEHGVRDGSKTTVSVRLEKNGERLSVNAVNSVHAKEVARIAHEMNTDKTDFANDNLRYVDKKKALEWFAMASPKEASQTTQELVSAANIVRNFENPKLPEEKDLLFRERDPEVHERTLARDRYEQRVKRGVYQTREALQDSMLGLREGMEAILKGEGRKNVRIEDVDGFENAYLGENRLSSVNKAEADAFAHLLFKPLLDEVAKLAPTKEARKQLTDYMMAKHGLERNRKMAERDAQKAFDETQKKHPNSKKTLQDFIDEYRDKDYAGLTALTETDNVADAEAEAARTVEEYESGHETDGLWKRTNAVSDAILSKLYETGMMSKTTYEDVRTMYDYYIPLRGFDEKTSEEAYAYLNSKNSAFNAPIKTAKGRKSKADDPFAYLQSMAESAITQGNRNKLVKQKFLNFVLNHPSDLASVSDIWLKHDDVNDEWVPVFPDNINADDTPAEVERKMQEFEEKMKELSDNEPDKYKHGKEAANIPYRVVEKRDLRQHQVIVKRGGRDYVITINGNPRAAQALNGQTNPDNDMSGAIGAILKAGERINRELSALYTTRNPDFVVSNFIRDMLYSNTMVWVKERPNYAWRFNRNFTIVNPARMKILLAKHRNGSLDMDNETERMFHDFMMNGGETGYANMRDIEKHKNDIRREIRKAGGKLPIQKAWDLLSERFDEVNRGVENCARFAAFMTSREMGRTIDRSIYDAKEISVNFNKKGSGAKFMGANGQTGLGNVSAFMSGLGRSGFVFWNAAIQGTTNFGRQFKRHPAKALTGVAAMFLLGAVVASLGYGDDDDDDKNSYWNLPEYVRRSNLLFKTGDQWISIPLPVEYRSVYGLGELMVSTMSGKEHLTDGEIANAIAGQVSQVLPLDFLEGGGGLKAFIPSSIKPFAEAYGYKKSWTGQPIYKDTPYNKDMPEWTKAYKSANKYLVNLSETLNELSGGDRYTQGAIDINPAKLEYVLNGYFGGIANTIDRMTKMGETIIGEREYDPKSFLVLNRILKNGDERTEYKAVNNEYFRLKEEHDKLKTRLRNYERDTANGVFDYAEKIDFLYNSPEYKRYEIFENYRPYIDDLYDMLKEANSYGDKEETKDLEAQLNELKKAMINDMDKTRK